MGTQGGSEYFGHCPGFDKRLEGKADFGTGFWNDDGNEQKPDEGEDLRPNGFTRESVFHDFPIRGQEVLLHVRRRRWLDADGHNVMTECNLIQESTRCSTELADFLKEAFGDAPYNGPFV